MCNADPATLFARTRIVRAAGTAAENGAALRAALAALPPQVGLRADRRLLLDPGSYDLGATALVLNGVVLEGAGRSLTVLTGNNPTGPVLDLTGDAFVSRLTVNRTVGTARGSVIRAASPAGSTEFTLEGVDVTGASGTTTLGSVSTFIEQAGGSLTVKDCFIGAFQRGPGAVVGLSRTSGSTELARTRLALSVTTAPTTDLTGLFLRGGFSSALIATDVTITLGVSATGAAVGIDSDASVTARRLEIVATGTAPNDLTGLRLSTPGSTSLNRFDFDNLRVDLTGAVPASAPRRAIAVSGVATLEVRHPYFPEAVGFPPGGFITSTASSVLVVQGVVAGVTATPGTARCVGVVTSTGAPVVCP